MANMSKRSKNHARVKRENSLLKRALQQQEQERVRATSITLLLLAKAGGDVVMDKAFLDSVKMQIGFMGFEYKVDETSGDMRVKAVLNEVALQEALMAAQDAQALESNIAPGDVNISPSIVLTDQEA